MKFIYFFTCLLLFLFSAKNITCQSNPNPLLIERFKAKYDSLVLLSDYTAAGIVVEKAFKLLNPSDLENIATFQFYKANVLETTTATNDQCEVAYDSALIAARKANNTSIIVDCLGRLIDFNFDQTSPKKSKREKIGLELTKILNESKNELIKAKIMAYLVLFHKANRNDKEALNMALQSLEIYKKLFKSNKAVTSDEVAQAYYQVSRTYRLMFQPDKQTYYLKEMRHYIEKNTDLLVIYYNLMAQNLFVDKKINQAISFNDSLTSICKKQENSINWGNLLELNIYFTQGFVKMSDLPSAKKYLLRVNEINKNYGTAFMQGNVLYTNGSVQLLGKKYNEAIELFKKAAHLTNLGGYGDLYQMCLLKTSICFENLGNWKEALNYSKKASHVADSLASKSTEKLFIDTEAKFQNKEKQQQIIIKNLQIADAQKQRWWYIGGLTLLALALGLLVRTFQIKSKSAKIEAEKNIVLEKLNTDLIEANQTKAKLFSIISHDLRSPISQVYQFLRLQQLNPDLLSPDQKTELSGKIQTATGSLLETMEDLLLWSKTQMSQFNVKMEMVEIKPVIDQCLQLLKLNIETKQLYIENTVGERLQLKTDPYFLQIIVRNLLQNAIKASPDESEIKISYKNNQLSIQNYGEPFTQNSYLEAISSTQKQETLNGLGLKLVDELSQKIGVKVFFEYQNESTCSNLNFFQK